MKVNSQKLKMMIFIISCVSFTLVFAKDKKTDHSYEKFCDQANGAEGQANIQLSKLNKKSVETLSLIKDKTNKLNAIKAKRIILDDLNSMKNEFIDTLVVGAGQAGLATSEHLSNHGVSHIIIEKNRLVESWRSCRWDSLMANGPAWHDRFPTLDFNDHSPNYFAHKNEVIEYFEKFAKKINAPVRTNVVAEEATKNNIKDNL